MKMEESLLRYNPEYRYQLFTEYLKNHRDVNELITELENMRKSKKKVQNVYI